MTGFIHDNYFESLFDNSELNAVLLMTTSGEIISLNPAFTKSFGYSLEELTGKNFEVLFTDEDRKKGRPQKELEKAVATGQADDKNYLVRKNRHPVWVSGETVSVVGKDGNLSLMKVVQDISDQKKAEHLISRANDFNETILTAIADIVIALDKDMIVVKANPAFYQFFGGELTGKTANFGELIKCFDKGGKLTKSISLVSKNNDSFIDLQFEISSGGNEHIFSISARQIHAQQVETGVLIVMHDITLQKQAEREREDIIGFVAHELRNPLSNVILCNEMLKLSIDKNDIAEVTKTLERSQHNIFRLNKMIAELYESTKISSGNLLLEITEFDADLMIKEAAETVQVLQPAFNISIQGSGGIIRGDRHRLVQVLTNYLSNGIKYSNGNDHVQVIVSLKEGVLTVAVKDQGLGIAPEQLPLLFNRFFRAEKTKNLEGIGLGLYLCRRIIDAHNGNVWAESKEGEGAVFYFSIPVRH